MRMKSAGLYLVAASLLLVPASGAWAEPESIAVTLTSPDTTYTAGQNNTFTFNVGMTQTGAEYVDRFSFAFPAAITVVSGTPASGAGTCGVNAGIQSVCTPNISWAKTGLPCSGAFAPTGCGVYNTGNYVFTVTVSIPAGFTGPLAVTLESLGDGFGSPPHTDSDTVTFTQLQGCTLTLACPADQTAGAPPGSTGTAVNFPLPTVGGTCTGATVACVPAPGDFFALGTTAVACTATVAGVPPATCAFNVTVDNQTVQEIPSASIWGLAALALLLAGAGFVALRRFV